VVGQADIKIKLGNVGYTCHVTITRGLTKKFLIGTDVLQKLHATLDFGGRTLNVGGDIILLTNTSTTDVESYSIVKSKRRTLIPPRTAVELECTIYCPRKAENYLISSLNNVHPFRSDSDIDLTDTIISSKQIKSFPLIVVNNTNKSYRIKRCAPLALAEGLKSTEILSVDSLMDTTTKPNTTTFDAEKDVKLDHLRTNDKQMVRGLLNEYKHLFAMNDLELGTTDIVKMTIDTGDAQPIKQKPYRTPLLQRPIIEKHINNMLDAGIIKESTSPWSSPVVLVPKKGGDTRFCIDYRLLNTVIKGNSYPLPNIDDMLMSLGHAKYFTSLDARSGYHQIQIAEEDTPKTAFICAYGLFEYKKMSFGIKTAPSIYQQMMAQVLRGIDGKFAMAYIDDILVYTSTTLEDHLEHVKEVFKRLESANLKLKPSKCDFLKTEIKYLGHEISTNGIRPDPEKVIAISHLEPPTNVKGVRSVRGAASFFRRFIPNFSEITHCMTELTKKNAHFVWTAIHQEAFDKLKKQLCTAPVLAIADPKFGYKLYTDASLHCVGAMLTQDTGKGEQVIQYLSHKLSATQRNWPTIERECYAIVYAVQKLRHYLLGAKFTVYTDHLPLRTLFTSEMRNAKIQRWSIILSEFDCAIEYNKGVDNAYADLLSRIEHPTTNNEINPDEVDTYVNVINSDKRLESESEEPEEESTLLPEVDFKTFKTISSLKELSNAQKMDSSYIEIIKYLNDKVANVASKSYVLLEDVLYHIADPVRLDNEHRLQIALPTILIEEVLYNLHDHPLSGHLGIDKTYDKIRRRFHWQNMYKDVVQHIAKCVTCRVRKLKKTRVAMQEMPMPEYPFEMVGIDTTGPYPESDAGNVYIITVLCHFSGWPECYAVPDKSARTVARVLMEEFLPRHSCPRIILSDNGLEYCNQVIDQLLQELNIAHIHTSSYHPQTQGLTERFHRFMNDTMAKYVSAQQRDWDQQIPGTLMSYRTAVQDSTRFTPFYLVYGRDPVLPIDTLLQPQFKYYGEDYVPTMLQRLNEAYTRTKENRMEAREKNRRRLDDRAEELTFEIGDPVYYYSPAGKPNTSRKLTSYWQPHYRIIDQTSPVNFEIRSQLTGKSKIVHAENLRAAHPDNDWDIVTDTPRQVITKYGGKQRWNKLEDPTRTQPSRMCKFTQQPGLMTFEQKHNEKTNTTTNEDIIDEDGDEQMDHDGYQDSADNIPLSELRNQLQAEGHTDQEDEIPLSELRDQQVLSKDGQKEEAAISEDDMPLSELRDQLRLETDISGNMPMDDERLEAAHQGDPSETREPKLMKRRRIASSPQIEAKRLHRDLSTGSEFEDDDGEIHCLSTRDYSILSTFLGFLRTPTGFLRTPKSNAITRIGDADVV